MPLLLLVSARWPAAALRALPKRRRRYAMPPHSKTALHSENGIEIAWNRGFADSEINDILRMVEFNLNLINETYDQLLA
jgi:hypothetical protein